MGGTSTFIWRSVATTVLSYAIAFTIQAGETSVDFDSPLKASDLGFIKCTFKVTIAEGLNGLLASAA